MVKRYFLYFVALTSFLALLFNVIEFFEKLVRSSDIGIGTIAYFSYLNFFSTFSELMPIGSWLAAVLVIREFVINNEWEPLFLVGINKRGFFRALLASALLALVGCFFLDEILLRSMTVKAEEFRQTVFKKKRRDSIHNAWYRLSDKSFCSIEKIDFKTMSGKGLDLFTLSEEFAIKEVMKLKRFVFNPDNHLIEVQDGNIVRFQEIFEREDFSGRKIDMSLLFGRIHLEKQLFTCFRFIKDFVLSDISLLGISQELWALFVKRIFFYLQIVFFALFSYALFILFEDRLYMRWVALLLPYPIHTVISVILELFVSKRLYFVGILGLYLLIISCIVIIHRGWCSRQ